MEVVVRERGRITLPAKVREALALREGSRLELLVRDGVIVLRPKRVVKARDLKGVIGPLTVELEEVEEALGRA